MGFGKLTEVVAALRENGLRAQRGYPGQVMPALEGVAAAVNIASVTPTQTQLTVYVYASESGTACEDGAQTAALTIEALGGVYQVGKCSFDGKMGVFACQVLGTWQEITDCVVKLDGNALAYVVAVSVRKTVSRTMVTDAQTEETVEECRDQGWNITIEELLPADTMPPEDILDDFSVYIYRPGGLERYLHCKWVQVSIKGTAGGLRRVRIARTWEEREVV